VFEDPRSWLWLGVFAIGAYHGLNPAMGWPLAVAQGMSDHRGSAVFATFVPLGAGHLLAMALVLLPFAVLSWLLAWQRELRIAAGALVIAFGVARLLVRRHPRWMMRIGPTQLTLWSLLMATAHGAALMLLPFLMGLCAAPAAAPDGPWSHDAVMALMSANLRTAVLVSLLHSAAMVGSGLVVAWLVYRHLGLRVLCSAWLDLDRVWALSLIVSGGFAVVLAAEAQR